MASPVPGRPDMSSAPDTRSDAPLLAAYAGTISLALVVVAISYLSLILGELVPTMSRQIVQLVRLTARRRVLQREEVGAHAAAVSAATDRAFLLESFYKSRRNERSQKTGKGA